VQHYKKNEFLESRDTATQVPWIPAYILRPHD